MISAGHEKSVSPKKTPHLEVISYHSVSANPPDRFAAHENFTRMRTEDGKRRMRIQTHTKAISHPHKQNKKTPHINSINFCFNCKEREEGKKRQEKKKRKG